MKIIHRFVANSTASGIKASGLDEVGVPYEFSPMFPTVGIREQSGLVIFEVSEDHPRWTQVQQLAAAWDCSELVRTEFTTEELKQAAALAMFANWHFGYPMPDEGFGFLRTTYAGTGCDACGVGHVQQAPFAMRAQPKWGRRHIMKLHWITDEFFVSKDTHAKVFAPFGIQCREVLHFKTQRPLDNVVQLCVPQTEVKAELPQHDEVCTQCGRGKYNWPVRGYFPRLDRTEKLPMFKTQSDFGSGGSCGKAIIVSQELYTSIVENRLRGCYFEPVSE